MNLLDDHYSPMDATIVAAATGARCNFETVEAQLTVGGRS